MEDPQQINEERIIRLLTKTISEEEKEQLSQWMDENPENRKTFEDIQFIWETSLLVKENSRPEVVFETLNKRIQQTSQIQRRNMSRRVIYPLVGIAATLLILFTWMPQVVTKNKFSMHPVAMLELTTPFSTKGNIELGDHSTVWVNENSTLQYPETFSGREREVKITGEACFNIIKDESKPFIVNLGTEKIKVLGTVFNVKNTEKHAEIVLLSGSIEFTSNNRMIRLQPNERICYNKETEEIKVESVDATLYNLWTKDKLVFDNADLTYIIACLEKWFDVRVLPHQPVDTISGISLTVRNETVEEVVKGIQQITPIQFTIKKE
ncbi:MAG: FecR family protein [Tannerellaceae bacterium]|nr:FecR family protein [Tannerellaceae bacterium]